MQNVLLQLLNLVIFNLLNALNPMLNVFYAFRIFDWANSLIFWMEPLKLLR